MAWWKTQLIQFELITLDPFKMAAPLKLPSGHDCSNTVSLFTIENHLKLILNVFYTPAISAQYSSEMSLSHVTEI